MKLKESFLLSELGGQWVLLPVGEAAASGKMLTLNQTGAFLLEKLRQSTSREALVEALLSRYAVEASIAQRDVDKLLAALTAADALETE